MDITGVMLLLLLIGSLPFVVIAFVGLFVNLTGYQYFVLVFLLIISVSTCSVVP